MPEGKEWRFDPIPEEIMSTQMKDPVQTMMMPVTISLPPQFENNKYELYRKELLWWRDIRYNIADAKLIIKISMSGNDDILNPLLAQFREHTRNAPSKRTMTNLLPTLDDELKKSGQETALRKVTIWANFCRKPTE